MYVPVALSLRLDMDHSGPPIVQDAPPSMTNGGTTKRSRELQVGPRGKLALNKDFAR
jgi:hypothetical protein